MAESAAENVRRGFETYTRQGVRATARETAREFSHPEIAWEIGPWAILLGGRTQSRGREEAAAA